MLGFVSRAQWEAKPPESSLSTLVKTKGVVIHYEGTLSKVGNHATTCANLVASIQRYHLNHPTENYSDIAYGLLVCQHGYVFEGRGFGKKTGANGSTEANRLYHSICWLGGPKMNPTPEALSALRWGIAEYRRRDQDGTEVIPHSKLRSTTCPGDDLRRWISEGLKAPLILSPEVVKTTQEDDDVAVAVVDKDLLPGFKGAGLDRGVMIGCVQGGNSGVDAAWLSLGCDGEDTGFRVAYRTASGVTVQHYVVSPSQGRYSLGMVSPAVTDLVIHRVPVDPAEVDNPEPENRSGEFTPAHAVVEYRS